MCAEMEIKMEIQLWKEILEPYGQAVDELVVKFNHIKREYQNGRMYSPIESVSGRVKSISSIMEKAQRKNVQIALFFGFQKPFLLAHTKEMVFGKFVLRAPAFG